MALKERVAPGARIEFGLGVGTEIELRVAELTVREVLPVALAPPKLNEALTWAVPAVMPAITPLPAKSATGLLSEAHVTEVVMS